MMLPSPTHIFDLPFLSVRPVHPINDALAPIVARAFKRERATSRRRIDELDGQILSRYARLIPIDRAVVRTANLDMLTWLCAGLDRQPVVHFDTRIPPLLAASGVKFEGYWVGDAVSADRIPDSGKPSVSFIL